jgi:hypothetical protein
MSHQDFVTGGGWQGADVVRLYTNIPHDSLVTALGWVFDRAWAQHPGQEAVLVFADKTFAPIWLPHTQACYGRKGFFGENSRRGMHYEKGACYIFT